MRQNARRGYVLRKHQHGPNSVAEWFKHGNIKINEDKMQAICSHQIRLPESLLILNEWSIPFVNNVKYLGVIIDRKITWRLPPYSNVSD
jgi:hypothetical protein